MAQSVGIMTDDEIQTALYTLRTRLRESGNLSPEENAALILATQWAESEKWPITVAKENTERLEKLESAVAQLLNDVARHEKALYG